MSSASHDHDHGQPHSHSTSFFSMPDAKWALLSLLLLLSGLALEHFFHTRWFKDYVKLSWYGAAYLPVGLPVILQAWRTLKHGEVFTEFLLMTLATLGAFYLGEYPEAVAVMLFYAIGEIFQELAVNRARRHIRTLLDIRPDTAVVWREEEWKTVAPDTVRKGEKIRVRAGEKVPLDGIILSNGSSFNTAALTGESLPATIEKQGNVLAGMINLSDTVEIEVTRKFEESSLARILEMVQHAVTRKARTEQFIRRFAKIYTPVVVGLAALLTVVPWFFTEPYIWTDWFYRALVFLVISCPCALVISIPLGYFGGIGAASRQGILFKGSVYLDRITEVNTVVMDKTGTLTQGVFEVQEIHAFGVEENRLIALTAALESHSTHPVAQAIVRYAAQQGVTYPHTIISEVSETAGMGLSGKTDGHQVLSGNLRLLKNQGIPHNDFPATISETVVITAIDGKMAGYFVITDQLREDAAEAISELQRSGIAHIVMLSGDKTSTVQKTASVLGIKTAYGDLLPEGKVEKLEELKKEPNRVVAFVGDGINDAPVLALSDVGIAMGGLGSDVAIETADVVIQTDQPSKIPLAIRIGKATQRVVRQNIALAFGVKLIVLALGAGGLATLWEAVFADVGVALLAILNATRLQGIRWKPR